MQYFKIVFLEIESDWESNRELPWRNPATSSLRFFFVSTKDNIGGESGHFRAENWFSRQT
jgi:hypothetical protein